MKLYRKNFDMRKGHRRKWDYMKGMRNDVGSTRNVERKALGRRRLRYDEEGGEER
jgi:hypothetical protein